jgi:hypothetical protein
VGLATNYYYTYDEWGSLTTGAIVGIAVSCTIVVSVMILGMIYYKKKHSKKNGHLSGSSQYT